MARLTDLPGLDPALAERLHAVGIDSVEGLAAAPVDTILAAADIPAAEAEALRARAQARIPVEDESTRAADPAAADRPPSQDPPDE